jgi:hypothetical protein
MPSKTDSTELLNASDDVGFVAFEKIVNGGET